LAMWRAQAAEAQKAGLQGRRRGPKPKVVDARDGQIVRLERELAKVTRRAERAEAIVEVQKKLSQLLGIPLPDTGEES